MTVEKAGDALLGRVEDDGVGFDSDAVAERDKANLHLGIYTMAERIRLADGALTIDSAPGHGTRVTFRMPTNV